MNLKESKENIVLSPHRVGKQYESPFEGYAFSLPREENLQDTGKVIPLSICNREKAVSPFRGG